MQILFSYVLRSNDFQKEKRTMEFQNFFLQNIFQITVTNKTSHKFFKIIYASLHFYQKEILYHNRHFTYKVIIKMKIIHTKSYQTNFQIKAKSFGYRIILKLTATNFYFFFSLLTSCCCSFNICLIPLISFNS